MNRACQRGWQSILKEGLRVGEVEKIYWNWSKFVIVIKESVQIFTVAFWGETRRAAIIAVNSVSEELGDEAFKVEQKELDGVIGSVSNQAIPILVKEVPILVTDPSV